MDVLSYLMGKNSGGGGGEAPVLIDKTITENGTYNASDDAADGYKKVVVDVPSGITELYDHALPSGTLHTEATQTFNIGARTGVTHIDAPNVTALTQESFKGWTGLATAYFPKVINTNSHYLFEGCSSLEGIVFPAIGAVNYGNMVAMHNMFKNCVNMQYFDAFFTGFNGWDTFVNDAKLSLVILRRNAVTSLGDVNKFNGTPFASNGSGGTLYVPSAQISSYQAATNWSTILGYANNQILPIEGSIYETQYADGTPVEGG